MGLGEKIESYIKTRRDWQSKHQRGPLGEFYRHGGNSQLYENLPVGSGDLVIDGGAYQGRWSDEILCRYGCFVTMFEPVPLFSNALRARYVHNNRVRIMTLALAGKSGQAEIKQSMDGSSIYSSRIQGDPVGVQMIDFGEFIQGQNILEVACLKLNIEGGEYEVLERLTSLDLVKRIRCLLVQFHRFEPISEARRQNLHVIFQQTHHCRFNYPFVWELWIRR